MTDRFKCGCWSFIYSALRTGSSEKGFSIFMSVGNKRRELVSPRCVYILISGPAFPLWRGLWGGGGTSALQIKGKGEFKVGTPSDDLQVATNVRNPF